MLARLRQDRDGREHCALTARATPIVAGFECSDMDSFYSSEHGGFGNRVHREADDRILLELAHGTLRVTSSMSATRLVHEVQVVEEAWVYDCVARWVFDADCAAFGRIADEIVPWGSRLYHEHAVDRASLGELRIRAITETLPANISQSLYLRCEDGRWIVHARAIAEPSADNVELFCKSTDGHSVAFDGSRVETHVLMRRREFAAPIYETQIQPHALLPAGTRFVIGLEID